MIRITQSYTIRQIIRTLESEGYQIIYKDLPHGRRGGIGTHAQINLVFEHVYDRSPDILALKDDRLLVLIEVDSTYGNLNEKFELFIQKKQELLEKISEILDKKITDFELGFGAISQSYPKIEPPVTRFHKFYFDSEWRIIHEIEETT